MDDPVIQAVSLGAHWPTVDPFLACTHHHDSYPAGNASLGPDASLQGRELGQDFAGIDGWRMYHGRTVPGFPAHPHRGFETVTYVREGLIDHADSLGATARFGRGDVQWLTAGRGIQHAEMFPLVHRDRDNPLELFQIWLNLPASAKLVEPSFTMFADRALPRVRNVAEDGAAAEITVIAGGLPGAEPPSPPPDSYAARPGSDVVIWHVVLEPGADVTLPAAGGPDTVRTLYVFDGENLTVTGHAESLGRDTGAVVSADVPVELSSAHGVDVLVLAGTPIAEPVAQYGPFVMNTDEEIRQAFADYRATGFGGWPWPDDAPVQPADRGRFARHADGTVEDLEPAPSSV